MDWDYVQLRCTHYSLRFLMRRCVQMYVEELIALICPNDLTLFVHP